MADKIIGIDLGTTNSCLAVMENGQPVVIPNAEGYKTTPSIVAFGQDGEKIVGQLAKRQAITNPTRTIESIKRHMGTKHRVQLDHREFSPEQISAMILQKLKKQAQDYLGQRVSKAIITVPAYFDDAQRLATRDAGQIAGLEVVRMINEPTACALTYGLHKGQKQSTAVVFDFGGGTFDVTVLEISEGVLHVRATNGNNQLGGFDFDKRIVDWIANQVKEQFKVDLAGDPVSMQRLREAAEQAKLELSARSSYNIQLPFLAMDANNAPVNFDAVLSVDQFNAMTNDLVEAARSPVEKALVDAKISAEQVDSIILAGGTTRVPSVQNLIRRMFNKEPLRVVNPDEAVAVGAAIQGAILTGEVADILLLDVVPMSIGIEKADGGVENVFKRNTVIPINKNMFLTNHAERQSAIRVHIVQGEAETAKDNKSLARFQIELPDAGPAKSANYDVAFSVDVDGILFAQALHKESGKPVDIELVRTHGLSREELKRLAEEAQRQADEDNLAAERTKAAAAAQCSIGEAERVLNRYANTLAVEEQKEIRHLMNELRNAVLDNQTKAVEDNIKLLQEQITKCVRAAAHPSA